MNDQVQQAPVDGAVEGVIEPDIKDLGGFHVRRVLPSSARRMVGPFIFFDHMGPAEFPPGEGIQVRPHPHIGLATVTYLFEGEIMHRDSLGFVQPIQAGAVNLMTAGSGIVHSERAGDDLDTTARLHGIQSWMALPLGEEECEAEFIHYPADELPDFEQDGAALRLIMGSAYGYESPVRQHSRTLYLECRIPSGKALTLPADEEELAVYIVAGALSVEAQRYDAGCMLLARPGSRLQLEAQDDCHAMVIGGASSGPRHIWWNFVSSSQERIERAKQDWLDNRFGTVPGETEFIPLPD